MKKLAFGLLALILVAPLAAPADAQVHINIGGHSHHYYHHHYYHHHYHHHYR